MSNRKNIKFGIILNYIAIILNYTLNILLLPILLKNVDIYYIGVWYFFVSISNIILLTDLGFSPTLSRNIAYAWSNPDYISFNEFNYNDDGKDISALKKIIISGKIIYFLQSIFNFIILATVFSFILYKREYIFNLNNSIMWLLYITSISIATFSNFYANILKSIGNYNQVNISIIFSKIIFIIVMIILFYFKFSLLSVIISNAISVIINNILLHNYLKKQFPIYKNEFISKNEFMKIVRYMWNNASKECLINISNYINIYSTNFIFNLYLPIEMIPAISIMYQLSNTLLMFSQVVYNYLQPKMHYLIVREKVSDLVNLFSISISVYYFIYLSGAMFFMIFLSKIINFLNKEITIDLSVLVLVLLYNFLYGNHSLYCSLISNFDSIPYRNSFILTSFLSLLIIFAYLYFYKIKLIYIVLISICCQLSYNNWYWPIYGNKLIKSRTYLLIYNFYKNIQNYFKYLVK